MSLEPLMHIGQAGDSGPVVPFDLERSFIHPEGILVTARERVLVTQERQPRRIQGIGTLGDLAFGDRLGQPSGRPKIERARRSRLRIVGIELNRPLDFGGCGGPVPVAQQQNAGEHGVCRREILLERERASCGIFCLLPGVRTPRRVEERLPKIRLAEQGVCPGELGRPPDRGFQVVPGLLPLPGASLQLVAGEEVGPLRFRVGQRQSMPGAGGRRRGGSSRCPMRPRRNRQSIVQYERPAGETENDQETGDLPVALWGAEGAASRCGQRRAPACQPPVQFVFKSVDGAARAVEVPMDGKAFGSFPPADRPHITAEMGRDFLP
jgi:hypothetical protein